MKTQSNLTQTSSTALFSGMKLLYLAAGVILAVAMFITMAEIWEDISSSTRITLTLGLGLLSAICGSTFFAKEGDVAGNILHIIGGMLLPIGGLVMLDELTELEFALAAILSFGALGITYWILSLAQRKVILTFFAIANTTGFVYSVLVHAISIDFLSYSGFDGPAYAAVLCGLGYLILSLVFRGTYNASLISMLNFFAALSVLAATYVLVSDSQTWHMLYVVVIVACILVSVLLESRSALACALVALVFFSVDIAERYFGSTMSTSIMLVIIAIGLIVGGFTWTHLAKNRQNKNQMT